MTTNIQPVCGPCTRERAEVVLIEVLANIQQESRAVREVEAAREGTEAEADPPRFSEPIDGEFSPAEGHECSGERCSDH